MSEVIKRRGFPQISDKAVVFEDARTILSRWREIDISGDSPEPEDIQPGIKDAGDQLHGRMQRAVQLLRN